MQGCSSGRLFTIYKIERCSVRTSKNGVVKRKLKFFNLPEDSNSNQQSSSKAVEYHSRVSKRHSGTAPLESYSNVGGKHCREASERTPNRRDKKQPRVTVTSSSLIDDRASYNGSFEPIPRQTEPVRVQPHSSKEKLERKVKTQSRNRKSKKKRDVRCKTCKECDICGEKRGGSRRVSSTSIKASRRRTQEYFRDHVKPLLINAFPDREVDLFEFFSSPCAEDTWADLHQACKSKSHIAGAVPLDSRPEIDPMPFDRLDGLDKKLKEKIPWYRRLVSNIRDIYEKKMW